MLGSPCPTPPRVKSLPLNLPKKSSRSLFSARYTSATHIQTQWWDLIYREDLHRGCLLYFLQVFAETKDELAVVLFGTDSTKNQLDQDDQYQNITVHRHLMVPDFELLEEIENQIHPESQQADCILNDWYFLKDRCEGTSNDDYMLLVYVLLDFYCYLFASNDEVPRFLMYFIFWISQNRHFWVVISSCAFNVHLSRQSSSTKVTTCGLDPVCAQMMCEIQFAP